jgi:hypothetical protein
MGDQPITEVKNVAPLGRALVVELAGRERKLAWKV